MAMTGHYIVCESIGTAVLRPFEVPAPKPGEVLLENEYTVVSAGTERANLVQLPNTGTYENGFPWRPGYCGAGRVLEVGEGVTNLKAGDRAIINWGGHRSHTVKSASATLRIDDDSVDLFDAAFAHIASFPMLGVRKLRVELGEAVMIAGQGILGVFALQFAQLSGAIPVLVADLDPERRALAMELGATAALDPSEDGFVEKVKALTGGEGPNGVVEVTGSSFALQQALEYIAFEGRVSLLGCTRISDTPIDFYKYVHRRGISLIGAHTFTRAKQESAPGRWTEMDDYRTFLKLVAAGKVQTRPIVSSVCSPEKAPEVYGELAENPKPPLGIVFDWKKLQ
jgi:2-desacetyl-2-hydroxyethyl bacteriochlorophyllide A dehydrogenase